MISLKPIQATGTVWHIEILDNNCSASELQDVTEAFLERFEQSYSRFRSDSWLQGLNRSGVFQNPSEEFKRLLTKSVSMYVKTDGVFNIAIGQNMNESGYDDKYSFSSSEQTPLPILTDILHVTDTEIILDEGCLDLGGIGKGFLIDELTKMYIKEFGLKHFIINGGGDIYATSDFGKPIVIALAHPFNRGESVGSVSLLNQGFAASSPHLRQWTDKKTNKLKNHLQTQHGVSSYVVSDNACDADVWATTIAIDTEKTSRDIKRLLLQNQKIIYCDEVFILNREK